MSLLPDKILEKSSKLVPLLYMILVFLGFYYYHIFYNHFEIEIFHYLSNYEILFSFISLVIPVLLLFISLIVYFSLITFSKYYEYTQGSDEESEDAAPFSLLYNRSFDGIYIHYKLLKRALFKRKFKKAFKSFNKLLGNISASGIKLALWLFFIIYSFEVIIISIPSKTRINGYYFIGPDSLYIMYAIAWLIIAFIAIRNTQHLASAEIYRFLNYSTVFIFLIGIISVHQKSKIEDILTGKENTYISFEYENLKVFTDDCIIFLGKTSNTIFLRDIDKGVNYIYPISHIRNLQTMELVIMPDKK